MENITANELLSEVKEELKKVQSGETFIVKDLFQGRIKSEKSSFFC